MVAMLQPETTKLQGRKGHKGIFHSMVGGHVETASALKMDEHLHLAKSVLAGKTSWHQQLQHGSLNV